MQVLTAGHKYIMDNFEDDGSHQVIQFIEKVPAEGSSGSVLETIHNGTTNEEVLRVLIDRMKNLQGNFSCRENAIVITKLEESLMWLEKRTADRKARGVEGKQIK